MCPLLRAPSTASSSCLTPSPYLSGPFSFRQQIVPLCRISRSTASSPSLEFALHQRYRLPEHFHFYSAPAAWRFAAFLEKKPRPTFCSPKVKNAVLSDQINNQPILPYTSSRQQAHEDRNRQPAKQRTLLGTSPVPAGLTRGGRPRRVAGRCRT